MNKGLYQWKSIDSFVKSIDGIPKFKLLEDEYKYEKSLGAMSYCFISLLKTEKNISLDKTAEILSKYNDINHKSKIRRLYDICKIFTALNLISHTQENKRPVLKWKGTENLENDLLEIVNSEPIEFYNDKNNQKIKKFKNQFYNKITKAVENSDRYKCDEETLNMKRRTSSFDMTIVEKFLQDDSGVVLPNVNIPTIEDTDFNN